MDETFTFNSAGGATVVRQTFDGGDGNDTLVAVFGTDGISAGARVTTEFTQNADGSFTATYSNHLSNNEDWVTISNIEDIRISTPDRYTWTDGNVYSLNTEDAIRTGRGNDIVRTFGGEDLVDVGRGLDDADGGAGIDGLAKDLSDATGAIVWDLQANTYSGPGRFTNFEYLTNVRLGSANDRVVTGNTIWTTASQRHDTISTGSGNDVVFVFVGRDTISMGKGTDKLVIDWRAAEFTNNTTMTLAVDSNGGYKGSLVGAQSGAPSATFSSVEHFTIYTKVSGGNGTNLQDSIVTGDGNDTVFTFASNDKIRVGTGTDKVDGGVGIDGLAKEFGTKAGDISIDLAANTFSGPGSYLNLEYFLDLRTGRGADRIVTSNVNDSSGRGDDVISTRSGRDTVTVMNGADRVNLGDDSDRLVVDWRNASFTGNTNMTLTQQSGGGYTGTFAGTHSDAPKVDFSGVENFTILTKTSGGNGTNLQDVIVTGNGNDSVSTFISNDRISVGRGTDKVDGGVGVDGIGKDFTDFKAPIHWDLGAGKLSAPGTFTNIEYFLDLRTGTGADVIVSGRGSYADVIRTYNGNDTVTLFGGVDTFQAGKGADRLVLDYRANSQAYGALKLTLEESSGGGYDGTLVNRSGSQQVTFTSVEHFTIHGAQTYAKPDNVTTGAGADRLYLYGGNDTADGGAGNDVVSGGDGSDTLRGGADNDKVYGGAGNDVLRGDAGEDGFYFDTALGSGNVDRILDFSVVKDTIFLDRDVFAAIGTGNLAAGAFRNGTAARDSSDRIIYDRADGEIFYDVDGTGSAAQILFATVTPGTVLTQADFVVFI